MSGIPSLAGHFLVARPILQDSSFARSVILLLEHGPEGAFGLIVNRPAKSDELPFPVFFGGPCKFKGLIMLHGQQDWNEDAERQVLPGVFLGDTNCLEKVTESREDSNLRFRVFSGYAGWGAKQLENEIAEGSWIIRPGSSQHLFETPVNELWVRLAPPTLPQPSLN